MVVKVVYTDLEHTLKLIKMERTAVLKTYKIYIGGSFPRTESGRSYPLCDKKGKHVAHVCLSSRKDLRNAVVAARKAQSAWQARNGFNRSQILYRIAEILEGRRAQFTEELLVQGASVKQAEAEFILAIDRLVYYAGWCDKYQAVLSSVNPVVSSHFNFTVPESVGVVGIVADEQTSLIGFVSLLAPILAGGNTVVVLASETKPLSAVTFAEVLQVSDVPGGVVNILTGKHDELLAPLATHMDVDAIAYSGESEERMTALRYKATSNLKRIHCYQEKWTSVSAQGLNYIADFQEYKTTWHPIESIGSAGSGY